MGYDEQTSLQLAKHATMFQNIADAEISAGDAAKFINSQMKAYQGEFKSLGSEGEKAAKVIDTVNEVANKNAVGTNDLQLALTKTSAAMGGFGNSFDEVVGIMTAGTEIMVGMPSQVARGWRTIGANILQIAQSSDQYVAASGKVNIATRDQNGEMKNTYAIMKDLYLGIDGVSASWKELSKEEQSAIALQLGGKNNMEKFRAVMDNFGTAIKATAEAQESQGSATRENARFLDSLQGSLQNVKSAWSEFSNAMVKSGALKAVLNNLAEFIRFMSGDFGQAILKGSLSLMGLGLGFKFVKGMAKLVINPFARASAVFGKFGKNVTKLNKPLGKVGKNMKAVQAPVVGSTKSVAKATSKFALFGGTLGRLGGLLTSPVGLVAGMLALGAGIMYVNTKINKAKSPEKQYEKTREKLGELEGKYDEVSLSIDKLREKQKESGLTSSEEAQLQALEREKEAIHENIEAYKELEKAQMGAKARTPDKKVEKTDKVKQKQRPVTKASPLGAMTEQAKKDAGATDLLTSKMVIYGDAAKKVAEAEDKVRKAREEAVKAAESGDPNKMAKAEKNLTDALKQQDGARKNLGKSLKDIKKSNDDLKKFYGSQERMPDDIRESSKAVDKLLESYNDLTKLKQKGGEKGVDFMGLSGVALDKTIQDFKTMGDAIGVATDKSGKLVSVDFSVMSSSLQEMGYSAEETRSALAMLGEQHPEATFKIEGVDVAGKDVNTVLEYLDKVNGKDADATIEIDGAEVAVSDITSVEDLLSIMNGKKFTPVIDMKGGEKSKDEIESVEESGKEIDNSTYTGELSLIGGEEVADQATTASKEASEFQGTWVATLSANTKNAQQQFTQVKNKQDAIKPNKTATITAKKSGESAWTSLKSIWDSIKSKTVTIFGKKVGDFAKGTRNAPEGLAEVNEQGWEFIRDAKTGKLRIAGGGKRTVTMLGKGDAVYTHQESKRMLSEARNIEIPQHAKGKKSKGKKQTNYDKKYDAITKWYDDQVKKAEHTQKMYHLTDKWLADQKESLRTKAQTKLNKLNKEKIAGKGKLKRKKSLTQDLRFDQEESMEDSLHDIATDIIDNMLSGQAGTATDLQDTLAEINRQASHLSEKEQIEYTKEAYKTHLEYNLKLFENEKRTYKDMRAQVEDYHKSGMISAKEYYDYLDDLMEQQLEKEVKSLEKRKKKNEDTYDLAKSWIDRKIESLEKENEQMDEQNELIEKQNDLEKARTQRIKVYRQGKGFVYEQDTQAIKEATSALREYKKEEESEELKSWRKVSELFDQMEASAEVANLERLVGASFGDLFGGFGTNLGDWENWLKNSLSEKYGLENLIAETDELKGYEAIQNFLQGIDDTISEEQILNSIAKNRFATGTLSAPAGFARVAENGYEIALLGKGDAVMPHGVSRNLMEWGQHSPTEFIDMQENGNITNYAFDSLVLPNVTDANSFIRELHNLPNKALQYSRGRA